MAWGKPIKNKYPATIKDIEKRIDELISMSSVKVITDNALACIVAYITNVGVPGGILIGTIIGYAKNEKDSLQEICEKLKNNPSKYKGVRFVQEFNPGPIYGYYEPGEHYYELY